MIGVHRTASTGQMVSPAAGISECRGIKGRMGVTYRIAGAVECDDLPTLVPEFTQSLNSVRPSGNPDRVDGSRVFKISDGESSQRPRGVPIYHIIIPDL